MGVKIAIYSRKSKFTGKGESINNQIETCIEYVKREPAYKDLNISDDDFLIYEDEGYSGKNINRPQFQRMMEDMRNKKFGILVFYRMDRISRSVADFHTLVNEFERYNLKFDSATENIDTVTPSGKAMMGMCSVFAQFERDVIAERIRDNMRDLAKTGRWLGGTPPTGYKSEKIVERINVDGKEVTAHKLKEISSELELVKLIYKKFLETNSLTKTETYFMQNRTKTKNGRKFTRFTIKTILQNPVYVIADKDIQNFFEERGVEIFADDTDFDGKHGMMAYNKTKQEDGKANKMRDMSEWIVSVGKHRGIISGADWCKTQLYLEQNRSKSYRKPKAHTALLSGVLICGKCGNYMRPKMYSYDYEDGEKRFSYLCELKEKSRQHNCQMNNPNGNVLDRVIFAEMVKLAADDSNLIKNLNNLKSKLEKNVGDYESQVKLLNKTISDAKKNIQNLIQSISAGEKGVAIDYIKEEIEQQDRERQMAETKLKELNALMRKSTISDAEIEDIKQKLQTFSSTFESMTYEKKLEAIQTIVRRVVWDGENIHLYFVGSEDESDLFDFDDGYTIEPQGEYCERTFDAYAKQQKKP